jgi:hypothetical protein
VMDGMAAEVSFELPPTHLASFLVWEPKSFPFIVRRHLPSLIRHLIALVGEEGELEIMVDQEREKREKDYQREGRETDEGWRTQKRKV